MIIDYIVPYRLMMKYKHADTIRDATTAVLPAPYNPSVLMAISRQEQSPTWNIPNDALDEQCGPPKTPRQHKITDFINNYQLKLVAVEAGVFIGTDLFEKFAYVDHYVYEGMERLTNQQFDSLADLSKQISEYDHSFWEGLSTGAVNKISGHVGEVYAADHLSDYGAEVLWPDMSNQAGWDLLVNGHELNVKLVADFNSLSGHFQQYPDIPVLLPGDAVNIPADAIHIHSADGLEQVMEALSASGKDHVVIVDDLLSHDAVIDQVGHASDALIGGQHMADFHFPFVTLLISGWREAGLLLDNKTNITNSIKNIGLDVAGGGLGAGIGAKGGAMIGMALGPVGAAFGAAIGGIAGAIGGRLMANSIKKQPYERAVRQLKDHENILKEQMDCEEKLFQEHFHAAEQRKRVELMQIKHTEQQRLSGTINELQALRSSMEWLTTEQARELLEQAIAEVNELLQLLRHELNQSAVLKRIFTPNSEQLALQTAAHQLHKIRKELKKYARRTEGQERIERTRLYAFLGERGLFSRCAVSLILESESRRHTAEQQLRSEISSSQQRLVEERVHAMQSLIEHMNLLRDQSRSRLNPLIEKIQVSQQMVITEGQKLGS